jgi:hypothetical protein
LRRSRISGYNPEIAAGLTEINGMRAETGTIVEEIKQSIDLLRRHL